MARGSMMLAVVAATACSGPIARSVGTGGPEVAYELRGQDREELHAQARQLCPHGYRVLRQAQRLQQRAPDTAAGPWLQQAGDWLSGMPGNEAQATVQCKA